VHELERYPVFAIFGVQASAQFTRNVLVALRRELERSPEALAQLAREYIEKGKPLQALVQLIDRVYDEEEQRVEMPSTLDEVRALSPEQRRILLRQLEQGDGPALTHCPHCSVPLLSTS
jgi:hypothetical protein